MTAPRAPYPPALLLALFAPGLVLVTPPESDPVGRAVLALIAVAAIVLLLRRRAAGDHDLGLTAALLLPVAAAAVLAAPARARAIDEAALFAALLLCGLVGRAALGDDRAAARLVAALAVFGTAVALLAIAQSFWLYPRAAAAIRLAGGAFDPFTDAALMRLEAGRPSGPLSLPTALAAYLAMTLPATYAVSRSGGRRRRALAWIAIGLQLGALLLTRSIGGLVAAAAAGVVLAWSHRGRRLRLTLAALGLATVLVAGGFLVARRAEIGSGPGRDPVSLRWGNWQAAVSIALENPLFGAGPGDFATAYTGVLRAGMNETRYAHNSWLQIVACWGLWSALPLAGFALAFVRRLGRRIDSPPAAALAAGGTAFLLHNLIDFSLYLPSGAVPGALLVGSVFASGGDAVQGAPPAGGRSKGRLMLRACAALLAAALLVHGVGSARVARALEAAQAAARDGRIDAALVEARRAAAARAGDPDPRAFLSEAILAHRADDPVLRAEGRRAAARAVRLDPRSAVRHATRAAYHAADAEPAAAAVEMQRARSLYPEKPQYRIPGEAP